MANIPGIVAKRAIITPNCRRVQGGALSAFREAARRLEDEYMMILRMRSDEPTFHVILSLGRPGEATESEGGLGSIAGDIVLDSLVERLARFTHEQWREGKEDNAGPADRWHHADPEIREAMREDIRDIIDAARQVVGEAGT